MIGSVLTVSMTGFTYGRRQRARYRGQPRRRRVTYVYSGALNGGQAYYEGGRGRRGDPPDGRGYYRLTISVATTDDYYGDTATTTFCYLPRRSFDNGGDRRLDLRLGVLRSVVHCERRTARRRGTVYYYYFGSSYDGSWITNTPIEPRRSDCLAGEYKMIAVVAQTDNYKRAESAEAEFAIAKADYAAAEFDMSGWTENDGVYYVVYDGNAHSPVLAALPSGWTGQRSPSNTPAA